jgi:hypothetical protein
LAAQVPSAAGSSSLAGDRDLVIPVYTTADVLAAPTGVINKLGLKHQCFYFADVDTADSWTSGIRGIVSLAWANEGLGGVATSLTAADTGEISLAGSSANRKGWLHVWSRG